MNWNLPKDTFSTLINLIMNEINLGVLEAVITVPKQQGQSQHTQLALSFSDRQNHFLNSDWNHWCCCDNATQEKPKCRTAGVQLQTPQTLHKLCRSKKCLMLHFGGSVRNDRHRIMVGMLLSHWRDFGENKHYCIFGIRVVRWGLVLNH